jgi:hypothetical protein
MKKVALFLAVAGLMSLAACKKDAPANNADTPASLDESFAQNLEDVSTEQGDDQGAEANAQ